MRPEDILRIAVPEDVALAPEARALAFTVRVPHATNNTYSSHIEVVSADGTSPQQMPSPPRGAWSDSAASWSPHGTTLAYLSNRSGVVQVWLQSGDGEPRQLTSFPGGAKGQPVWCPDGERLLVGASEDGVDDPAAIVMPDAPPFVVSRITYRVDGQGYLGRRFVRLWVLDVRTGDARPLTDGPFDALAPAWAPGGREVVFVANRADERLPEFRSALWIVPAEGGEPRRITPDDGVALSPAFSPDGREIAYTGLPPGKPSGSNHQLLLASIQGGAPRSLTGDFEGHVGGSLFSDTWQAGKVHPRAYWTPDGEEVRFLAAHRGSVGIFEVNRRSEMARLVDGERACAMLSVSSDGRTMAYAACDMLYLPDVYIATPDGERRVSDLNPWWDGAGTSAPRHLSVAGEDGAPIDAWLVVPPGEPSPGPLVQYIHGGPHSIFGHVFFLDMLLLAANGYRVLFANPRATRGYGDDFALCNLGRWGEGDTPDQLAALEAALETGWVDRDRLGVMGLSYGGYMTNWLLGHTDCYRAGVSENSISNLISFCGTSDIGWYFGADEMGVEPEANPDLFERLSPLNAADTIRAPLLLLNCLEDWRCPVEQGEQLYTALKKRGCTVEMVCFPGEGHTMLSAGKPRSRVERRRHILRWFEQYLIA